MIRTSWNHVLKRTLIYKLSPQTRKYYKILNPLSGRQWVDFKYFSSQSNKEEKKEPLGENFSKFTFNNKFVTKEEKLNTKEDSHQKTKKSFVEEVFSNVAGSYDLMNDIMSVGIHRLWKNYFVQRLAPTQNIQLLDVAGGTGDIAFNSLEYIWARPDYRPRHPGDEPLGNVIVCDINENMLTRGKERAAKYNFQVGENSDPTLKWVQGDAENLPFNDNSFTAYTVSFGIRNCSNLSKVLKEAYRVLKPGGRFMCLEFSHVNIKPLSVIYDIYSYNVIPFMGKMIANDEESYRYLVESIRAFPVQDEFAKMIQEAGFKMVTYENLNFGVAAIHSGFKL